LAIRAAFTWGGKIEAFTGRDRKELQPGTLDENRRDPISYFAHTIQSGQSIEGMVSAEFNLDVMQIVEAAIRSAKTGKPVTLPLR
jgi:predicted dehydrogenase